MTRIHRIIAFALVAVLFGLAPAAADETCQSPYMPKLEGQEDFVYIWTLGIEGVGCVNCHVVKGQPPLTHAGIELVTVTERLRPSWFARYLIDPQAYRPGTLMPASWPDGVAAHQGILGGDTDAQALIAAMEGMTFDGPKGEVYIRPEDHVAIQDMYIVTIKNIDDPEFKFFELVETTRPEPPCLLPEDLQDRCGDLPIGSMSGQ